MSEINIHNPSDGSGEIDIESVFFSIAAQLQPDMAKEHQERIEIAELAAMTVADNIETHYKNVQSTKLIAFAGLAFAVGWIVGKK